MSTDCYDFDIQLSKGNEGERFLDEHFSSRVDIVDPESQELQDLGIDRVWTFKQSRRRWTVEYKTCDKVASTGNIFVEIVSNDQTGKPGWALTCGAQLLVYYSPQLEKVWFAQVGAIKLMLPKWSEQYPSRPAPNEHYNTIGLLVPVEEFEKVCWKVLSLAVNYSQGESDG